MTTFQGRTFTQDLGDTLPVLAGRARSMAGHAGDAFNERRIYPFLKEADQIFSQEVEGMYGSTFEASSVADQAEYTLPARLSKVVMVTYDGRELEEIGWRRYQELTADGQATGSGTPRWFVIWDGKLILVKPPSAAGTSNIVVRYIRRPIMEYRGVTGTHEAGLGGSAPSTTVIYDPELDDLYPKLLVQADYFAGCMLTVELGDFTSYSVIANTLGPVITVDPAFNSVPTAGTTYTITDVLEMPGNWTTAAVYYAAAMICRSHHDPSLRQMGDVHWRNWEDRLRAAKKYAQRPGRGSRKVRVKYY